MNIAHPYTNEAVKVAKEVATVSKVVEEVAKVFKKVAHQRGGQHCGRHEAGPGFGVRCWWVGIRGVRWVQVSGVIICCFNIK